ncbi:MAG TPA: methyltransferase domain-containing protein [Candidatus Binataceae bacterium]|nr:methyltransferase domain-containing protein [Candidatus Binataceae bacterium]
MAIDEAKLNALLGKMVGDLGAAAGAALVVVGDKLGLYRAIAEAGAVTPTELAKRTGTTERYVREWLAQQAAAGYVEYDAAAERYSMSPEQQLALATEGSPACVLGAFEIVGSVHRDEARITDAFRSGKGVGWHEHDVSLFRGTERFFRPTYAAHLVNEWLPALEGVREKLERGARVADVGCGRGASAILMAQAFPKSQFFGFDYHQPSLDRAIEAAREAGVSANTSFSRAVAKDYPGTYDLVAFFDCLHDMGDPAGAAAHVLQSLTADGTWMIVEPMAGDSLAENLNPFGRLAYTISTMICTPASMAQEGQAALGTQAGEKKLREVIAAGGFTRIRRTAQTPFNMVLEARA